MEHYKHETGLDFEFGYVESHDITVVLLYTGDDFEHDHYDPYLVGWCCGKPEELTEDDAEHVVSKWLATKSEEDVQRMLKMQQELDKEIASWNNQ